MAVQQFFYTSWADTSPGGESGFHMRGASPGLTPDDRRILTEMSAYAIPPRLDPREIASHPVALRYRYLSPEKAALVCVQSVGADELGRTGNFFAHGILLDPETFTIAPPAFFWRSPFWRTSDTTPGTNIPALPDFDVDFALQPDQIWRFIADPKRRGWLYSILCAVVQSSDTQRRVVIVDTPEHVALWVAAASLLLPSNYRPLLSFATYQSDPYRANYLITGARSDVEFQLTPMDFKSFFVLDTESGRVSEIADSPYARFVTDNATPEQHEARTLGLLSLCDRLFPPDGAISARLDDAAAYYARAKARSGPVSEGARRALTTAIDSLVTAARSGPLTDDRRDDLRDVYSLLVTALPTTPEPDLIKDFERVMGLMRSSDPQAVASNLPNELILGTQLMASSRMSEGQAVTAAARRVYGDATLEGGFNSPAYLAELTRLSGGAPVAAMLDVWQSVTPAVRPSPDSSAALAALLKRAPQTNGALSADGEQVAQRLADATRASGQAWLGALARDTTIPFYALYSYYYYLAGQMAPAARAPLRALMPNAASLPEHEMRSDLATAALPAKLDTLERWAEYASQDPAHIGWVSNAMNLIWTPASERDRITIARRALTRPVIVQQLNSTGMLLHTALTGMRLTRPSADDMAFVKQYYQRPELSNDERVLMMGVLAMGSGEMDHKQAEDLRVRFGRMSREQYETEAHDVIYRFFEGDVSQASHAEMVVATYNTAFNEIFWQNYGGAMLELMVDQAKAKKVVSLLGFWFDSSLSQLGRYPYVVQLFFMNLPSLFDLARKERGYRDAGPAIDNLASKQEWYPLVKTIILQERKGFLGMAWPGR